MVNKNDLFVERRKDGRYAIKKPNAERSSSISNCQGEAIERAQELLKPGGSIRVERVRNTKNGHRDHWRKP